MPPGRPPWLPGKRSSPPGRPKPPRTPPPAKGGLLNNGDPHFKNEKEKIYDHFPLSVHQMDILIGVLVALIVIFVFLGVNQISFFGLF